MIKVIMRPIVADFTCVFNNYNYTLSYSNNVILVLQIHNSNLIQNTSVNLIVCWHILVEVIISSERVIVVFSYLIVAMKNVKRVIAFK